ncbi:MAG: hypothetical protein Q9226_005877 [Calogaya cf. arnoldii]
MEGIELYICFAQRGPQPRQLIGTELKKFLAQLLKPFKIINFEVQVLKSGNDAVLTTHKRTQALQFLQQCQQPRFFPKLVLNRRRLIIKTSVNMPDKILVRVLEREEKAMLIADYDTVKALALIVHRNQRECKISSFAYGKWEYVGPQACFHPYFDLSIDATAAFGDRYFVLTWVAATDDSNDQDSTRLNSSTGSDSDQSTLRYQLRFPYSAIESTILDHDNSHALVYTLNHAPKVWVNGVRAFGMDSSTCCQEYRFELQDPSEVQRVLSLERDGVLPQSSLHLIKTFQCNVPMDEQLGQLASALEDSRFNFDFGVKFQVTKLAQNGFLPPRSVFKLIDHVSMMQSTSGASRTAAALRRLCQQIPYAGPFLKASALDPLTIAESLDRYVEDLLEEQSYLNNTSDSISTFRADVTPSTLQLVGPELESSNRVLRNYASYSSHFLRVTFMEEDGEPFYFDHSRSNRDIFWGRFDWLLQDGIKIGGRLYEFLGFSHSSLRAQTCWFLAPFTDHDKRIDADTIIYKLGDFSHIQCPAKCAARIGQAFTDTSSSIVIDPAFVEEMEDVERNGRVFSDGVGTCSLEVLKTLQSAQKSFAVPATVFQIRYAGAKGVISLDSRLQGHVLRLGPSIIKYRGTEESHIEVCGVAPRKLPLVLNRSLIQILEDLGIPNQAFEALQTRAIDELRSSVSSVANAAAFLEKHNVGKTTDTPWLLRKMQSLGLALSDDLFFRDLLDAVILIQLQDLKYKTRIPVEAGATLYGIMDETGLLDEGQVYCCWLDLESHIQRATGTVLVTRSPALHTGDVQRAQAVTVPDDSPLTALHNCIVFSAKGERDLPSQLSGGDLDGDLYHVIWDKTLIPNACYPPSQYPRLPPVDIGRPITRTDMSNFFLKFMEQDLLGRVSTQHLILADQFEQGTLHPDCIKLAELSSTAVDFAKTGIPIYEDQFSQSCRNTKFRPDFMAPARTVKVEEHGIIFEREHIDLIDDDDARKAGEGAKKRYYESKKTLGILYRSIDERVFFKELHERSAIMKDDDQKSQGVLGDLWDYIQVETVGLDWEHYINYAVAMRNSYEATVTDIILQYSTNPPEYLEEIEVFMGSIICRTGFRSKRQKEYTTGMKEKYDREVKAYLAAMRDPCCGPDSIIATGEPSGDEETWEALRRSMACLDVGMRPSGVKNGRIDAKTRVTFGWLAALAVMQELEVYQEDRDVGPLRKALKKMKTLGKQIWAP